MPKLTDGLIEFWRLNETSGSRNGALAAFNLADSGATGATNFQPENNVVTESDGAALFTATTALSVASAANLQIDNTKGFTISAWANVINSTIDQYGIAGKATAAEGVEYSLDYLVLVAGSPGGFAFRMGPNFIYTAGSNFPDQVFPNSGGSLRVDINRWYHLVGTYNPAGVMTFWQNNNYVGIVNVPVAQITTSVSKFAVGAHVTSATVLTKPFGGAVCNVGIWRRELTREEIGNLYNGGISLAYPFTSGAGTTY